MTTRRKLFTFIITTCIISAILFSLFGHYKTDIIEFLQKFAIKMRSHKYSPILMATIVSITGIPPVFGFTFAVTLTGFVYGFPKGCIPATVGAFLSALITCGLIRKFKFGKNIKLSDKRQELYLGMQDAITHGGFKMIVLIRICPLPWQLTNLFLSLVPTVSLKSYIFASLIGAFRFNMDVWVGSQLADLSDPNLPPETHKATLIYMCIGILVLLSSGLWIYKVTMLKIREQQEKLLMAEQGEHQPLLDPSLAHTATTAVTGALLINK
ncbi:hypothetical protein BD770DRAFT_370350 [Pilaira anomala]|nr:hypothetical protein BD770DRAFT_370350 [Pilaira anomala]